MIRSMSYRRYFKMPMLMPAGRLNTPKASITLSSTLTSGPENCANRNVPARPMTVMTPPAMSHFSWARRSPVARRQLRT
jgi:hypothetical protein